MVLLLIALAISGPPSGALQGFAQYDRNGRFVSELKFDAKQISCPAMGGENMSTLFATSASVDLDNACPNDGKTFLIEVDCVGQEEHQVKL